MPKVIFNNKNSVFFTALKTEVEQYFLQKQIKRTGNWKLYIKPGITHPICRSLVRCSFVSAYAGSISRFFMCVAGLYIRQYRL